VNIVALGNVSVRVLTLSTLHVLLHLHVPLTRRANGQSLGNLQCYYGNREALGRKFFSVFNALNRLISIGRWPWVCFCYRNAIFCKLKIPFLWDLKFRLWAHCSLTDRWTFLYIISLVTLSPIYSRFHQVVTFL